MIAPSQPDSGSHSTAGGTSGPGSDSSGRRAPRATVAKPRDLPHSPELEKSILGCLLAGDQPTAIHEVRQVAEHPLHFYGRDHRIIYVACLEIDDTGHRIDAAAACELLSRYPFQTMMDRLKQAQILFDSDQLDALDKARLRTLWRREAGEEAADPADSALMAIGGANTVFDLVGQGSWAGLKRNAVLLRDAYLKRRMIRRMSALVDRAYLTPDTFTKLIDEGSQAMLELGRHGQTSTVHSIQDTTQATLEKILENHQNPETGITTGIPDIDEKLIALRPGGLYILAARPGVGKTSLALKIAANIAARMEGDGGILFFSLEVDRVDLLKKMLSAESTVPFGDIDRGSVTSEQWELVQAAASRFSTWNFDLMDVSDLTVHGLRAVVRRRKLETQDKLKLVVIDYLQLLNSQRPDASEYEKVSEITRVLKVLARDLRIPVMALSQMSRDSEKGVSNLPREPRLSDLRGSGSIEQDADSVLFIHRVDGGEEATPGQLERRRIKLIIAKNRFGPTGQAHLDFYPANMRFVQSAGDEPPADIEDNERKARATQPPRDEEDMFK